MLRYVDNMYQALTTTLKWHLKAETVTTVLSSKHLALSTQPKGARQLSAYDRVLLRPTMIWSMSDKSIKSQAFFSS